MLTKTEIKSALSHFLFISSATSLMLVTQCIFFLCVCACDNLVPCLLVFLFFLIVSTRSIQWILWFSIRYTAITCREIFDVNTQRKTRPASFTKFAGYLHWEVSFSGTEISFILKNKITALKISLQIIYLFLLASSHN